MEKQDSGQAHQSSGSFYRYFELLVKEPKIVVIMYLLCIGGGYSLSQAVRLVEPAPEKGGNHPSENIAKEQPKKEAHVICPSIKEHIKRYH